MAQIWFRRVDRWLMILAALMLVGSIVIGWRGLFVLDEAHGSSRFVAAAGFLAASAGWSLTSAISILVKVRERSLDYLESVGSRANHAATLNRAWKDLGIDQMRTDPEALRVYFFEHSLEEDHKLFTSLRALANSYEEIGVAVRTGAVDEEMLRRAFGTSFIWFSSRLAPFIQLYRNYPPIPGNPRGPECSPKTFSHCVWLAKLWRNRQL